MAFTPLMIDFRRFKLGNQGAERVWVRPSPFSVAFLLIVFYMGLGITFSKAMAQRIPVDLELVIAVDISGSVDDDEAALQRQGYIKAFRDPRVIDAIMHGPNKAIAVTYIEWAGMETQRPLVKWSLINSAQSANNFADELAFEPIMVNVWTSISGAILAGEEAFRRSPFKARRRVIDISGDGANNDGPPVQIVRDKALARGLTINGLPIINDRPSRYGRRQIPNLDYYYADCVIGGPGAFLVIANGFDDFARAVRRKLILEIAGAMPPVREQGAIMPVSGHDRPPCTVGESLRQDWDDF